MPLEKVYLLYAVPVYINKMAALNERAPLNHIQALYLNTKDFMPTGIVESLKKLLTDSDITVRQKSTECFYVIAGEHTRVQINEVIESQTYDT